MANEYSGFSVLAFGYKDMCLSSEYIYFLIWIRYILLGYCFCRSLVFSNGFSATCLIDRIVTCLLTLVISIFECSSIWIMLLGENGCLWLFGGQIQLILSVNFAYLVDYILLFPYAFFRFKLVFLSVLKFFLVSQVGKIDNFTVNIESFSIIKYVTLPLTSLYFVLFWQEFGLIWLFIQPSLSNGDFFLLPICKIQWCRRWPTIYYCQVHQFGGRWT